MRRSGDRVIGKLPQQTKGASAGGPRTSGDRSPRILLTFVAVVLYASVAAFGQAPEGIPRDLARARADRVFDVRYNLDFKLTAHADSAQGREELRFKLRTPGTLLLDFRGGSISKVEVNGKEAPAKIENGHLELAGDLLKVAPNASGKTAEDIARASIVATDNLGRPVGTNPLDQMQKNSPDDNVIRIEFTAPIAPAGKAITRFEDKDDGSEYLYTLFVPMDANMAFPCFDQPDIKAVFSLDVTAPEDWVVISNGETWNIYSSEPGTRRTTFNPTRPISTYLFAFAAGPFMKIAGDDERPTIFVRQSKYKRAQEEAKDVQQITAAGKKYLSEYFDQPFPFDKYDLVLIPGFAYGGMEHAGATFVREESVLFRTAPTHSDYLNRDILLLHELTHQWFGDEVTMRWFDDLWLKEGFAQYMAYHALADLKPKEAVWKRFYQSIKPAAYGIDATQGTTPIYQDIANLKDAKSAYGAIVYSKAPGVMRQLAFVIGEDKFRDGLRLYLKDHAYRNAEWKDLVAAFESTSGKKLQNWAEVWIHRRGMPQVDVQWSCSAQRISKFTLTQHDVLNEGVIWPLSTQVLLSYRGAAPTTVRADLNSATTQVKAALGKPCPAFVFANDQDYAYGRFLLDPVSRPVVMQQLGGINDIFERTMLWGSLWESVREAQMDPRQYVELALRLLPQETDEALAQNVITRTTSALHHYVSDATRAQIVPRAETLAYDRMLHSPEQDMHIVWFRGLRGVAETSQGRGWLKQLLDGKLQVPGLELRPLDRWNIVTSLVALNDPQSADVLAAEEKHDPSGDGKKYAYMAAAARPDDATKKQYFNEYLHDASRPEDWVEQSLGAFNFWNQSQLTFPYLRPALDSLPQMKRERKIFFVLAWLNSFIDGQKSPQAQAQVQTFVNSPGLDKDLKLKVLEVKDDLDRTVKIRSKYAAASKGKSASLPGRPAGKQAHASSPGAN